MEMSTLSKRSFKDIVVGEKIPEMSFHVTQEYINQYAEASGDFNPLHIDEEFAKNNTPFNGTIAHGLMTLAFISQAMSKWDWKGWVYGGIMDVTFISPVRPNDTVTIFGKVIEKVEHSNRAIVELDVKNNNGDTIVVGKAHFNFKAGGEGI
jgi:3-hydroxybutyryl-CoA dehydratase